MPSYRVVDPEVPEPMAFELSEAGIGGDGLAGEESDDLSVGPATVTLLPAEPVH